MPLPFSLHATGTGKINVGAAPSAEALLLCFSTCHSRHKDEKPSVFVEYFHSFKNVRRISRAEQGANPICEKKYSVRGRQL